MKRYDALRAFREKWPDVDVTDVAFFNQRSRMGAADNATYKGSRKPRPLYAEQIKKDYPQFPAYEEYSDLLNAIKKAL